MIHRILIAFHPWLFKFAVFAEMLKIVLASWACSNHGKIWGYHSRPAIEIPYIMVPESDCYIWVYSPTVQQQTLAKCMITKLAGCIMLEADCRFWGDHLIKLPPSKSVDTYRVFDEDADNEDSPSYTPGDCVIAWSKRMKDQMKAHSCCQGTCS